MKTHEIDGFGHVNKAMVACPISGFYLQAYRWMVEEVDLIFFVLWSPWVQSKSIGVSHTNIV
jgi:hypothetical protein